MAQSYVGAMVAEALWKVQEIYMCCRTEVEHFWKVRKVFLRYRAEVAAAGLKWVPPPT